MPRWPCGQWPTIGGELRPNGPAVLGPFIDLERQHSRTGVGCQYDDAVRTNEVTEAVAGHSVWQPELDWGMLAIVAPVQRDDGIDGVEHMSNVARWCGHQSGNQTLMTSFAHAVGVLAFPKWGVGDGRAFKQASSIQA
jgi:hypothetical protein